MSDRIRFTPVEGTMLGSVSEVPAFPGATFLMCVPEAIGDVAQTVWQGLVTPQWQQHEKGVWTSDAACAGELAYRCTVAPHETFLDVTTTVTNLSDHAWANSLAFTCLSLFEAPAVRDHECVRHWAGVNGQPRRLVELPRRRSRRPTCQLYHVAGQPPPSELPFVAAFEASPDATLDPWLAVSSQDGSALVAAFSPEALFLFQNMEFSCIHACPSHGALAQGETGTARVRYFFVQQTIDAWHARLRASG
jgi:hypothetical protein